MFQFQNYPLNDLWAGRKYIVDMWAKPLGLARKGRKLAWDGKRRADRRRNAGNGGEGASERAKGERRGWGEEGAREKGRAWLPLGDKWPSTDGRHIQIAPRCRCPASFYACPPLSRIIPHVAFVLASERPISKIFGEAATRAELF